MLRFQCLDLRKMIEAISRQQPFQRMESAAALRGMLTRVGAPLLGLSDEDVGSNSAALVRRLGATISFLRGMERDDWQRPEEPTIDGVPESSVRIDPVELARQEVQEQAEAHGRGKRRQAAS